MAALTLLILSTCAIVSIVSLLCILILHLGEHFNFRCCYKRNKILSHRASTPMLRFARKRAGSNTNPPDTPIIVNRTNYQSCITAVDEESFDFFPVSFIFYLMLLICITSLLLYKLIEIDDIININLNIIHSNHAHSVYFHLHLSDYHITDWIIIYSEIIISVWDSIFSFYRYYTTQHCANYFHLLSFKRTLAYFSLYAVPYLVVSLLQIHMYYYLYPILIIAHCMMNVWCNWMFAKILIDSTLQYSKSEKMVENAAIHDEMLRSVYFMRRTSLMWCCISVVCHSMFITTYSVEIMCLYPLLWSIGCILFALNFVRNRSRIYETSFAMYQSCKHCSFHNICNCHTQDITTEWELQLSAGNSTPNTDDAIATKMESGSPKNRSETGTDIDVNSKSTVKSTDIKSTTHTMDAIGGIDVFEDEDEMMVYEYDAPTTLMALNRNMNTMIMKQTATETRPRSVTLGKEDKSRESTSFVSRSRVQHLFPDTGSMHNNMADMYSMSDPIDILAQTNQYNKQQHRLNPTLEKINLGDLLEDKSVDIDLYGADDEYEDDIDLYVEEETENEKRVRSNKALEILGLTQSLPHRTSGLPRATSLKERVRSVSGTQTDLDLPSTTTFGHQRSLSQGQVPTSSDFTFDEAKFKVIIDKIDEIEEDKEDDDIDDDDNDNNDREPSAFALAITSKLEMIQGKAELHTPSILRRLDYQRKLPSKKPKLKLKRSASAPSSPRRMAQYIAINNTHPFKRNSVNSFKRNSINNAFPYSNSAQTASSSDMMSYIKMNQNQDEIQHQHDQHIHVQQQPHNRLSLPKLALANAGSAPLSSPKNAANNKRNTMMSMEHARTNTAKHCASKSVINGKTHQNIHKAMKSSDHLVLGFNALVLQGFYSRKSLNSVQQLTQLKTFNGNRNSQYLSAIKE